MAEKITPVEQIADCKKVVESILKLDISDVIKGKVIRLMIWNITGAYGKTKTRFISKGVKNDIEKKELKYIHEHVFRIKLIIDNILKDKSNFEKYLDNAVVCTVTEDEHKKLNKVDKKLDEWDRYNEAGIIVYDTVENRFL